MKFFLIFILVMYLVYKVSTFLLRNFLVKAANQAAKDYEKQQTRKAYGKPADGNVVIDYIPDPNSIKSNKKGGDYVDYEEVK